MGIISKTKQTHVYTAVESNERLRLGDVIFGAICRLLVVIHILWKTRALPTF